MAEYPLHVWNAAAATHDSEVETIGGAGQGDVERLSVEHQRHWIVADHPGAVEVQRFARTGHVRGAHIKRRWRCLGQARQGVQRSWAQQQQ